MEKNEKRLLNALTQIAEVATSAIHPTHEKGNEAGYPKESTSPSHEEPVGCTIKSLPGRLHVPAARTAVNINPLNAPAPLFTTLTDAAADLISQPQFLAVLVTKYWGPTPRQLTVSFMETTPADLRARIVAQMNAWTKTACISFAETQGVGHVRISRGPGGYWSYLGTDIMHIPQDRPTMNLEGFTMATRESEFVRVVRHETGHTLGFPHEHMRQELIARINREKAYAYFLRTQGWDQRTVDAQVLTPLDQKSIMATPPDQDSIMCYQLPGSITTNGQPIRGGADINATDFAFAGRIYPKAPRTAKGIATLRQVEEEWQASEDVQEPEIAAALQATITQFNGAAH
jgi:hypothetical protein